jgi:TfoX/Sxy family transcriptional regulator of competence genes
MSPSTRREMPAMPKPDDDTKAFFRTIVPEAPDVQIRPMFGNLAAFVNGNMFTGLFGADLFVRVSGADRDELVASGGGSFEPMPGRAMTGYTTLPDAWRRDEPKASEWVLRALESIRRMPPKQPKPKAAAKKTAS